MPATRLEKRSRTAQNNRTQGYVAHFQKNHHRLLLDNWNILTLSGKELSDCVFGWIPLGSRACMLKLKVKDRLLYLLQVYAPNAVREYQAFVDDVNDALQKVRSTESAILWGISTHTLEQTMKHGKA